MTALVGQRATREASETEQNIPVAKTFEMKGGEMPKIEPQIVREGNRMFLVGSELALQLLIPAAISGVTATVPQGGVLGSLIMNPLYCDGMRVAKMMSAFDQWALLRVANEYVPLANAVSALGGIIAGISNDTSDLIGVESGWSALRDLASRPGSTTFNVYSPSMSTQNQPLLKWYLTASPDEADLAIPGVAYWLSANDQSNSTTSPVLLGLVWMHYEIELRSAETQSLSPQSFNTGPFSLSFTTTASAINTVLSAPSATCGINAVFLVPTVVGMGIVCAADDVAWGSATWRTWQHPSTGKNIVVGPGAQIFWRFVLPSAVCFFFSLKDAMDFQPANLEAAVLTTVTQVNGTVRGFKVYGVAGFTLPGF